ncbi:chloride channel protein [Bombella intestini]|nr:chloride channel protein [Bombella intestini]
MPRRNGPSHTMPLAPAILRSFVRRDGFGLFLLALLTGGLAGGCVVVINTVTLGMHVVLYGLHNGGRLSELPALPLWRCLMVLGFGGLVVGLVGAVLRRRMVRRPVDPVEANALRGGRMSVRDSISLAVQTVLSNGVGASIGLEAGYVQISAAFGSWLGRLFRVRREELRILVGAGAAGAVSAGFDAPIAGAFYAFEIVLGTYSLVNLFPIALAAMAGLGVRHLVRVEGGVPPLMMSWHMGWSAVPGVSLLAILCALTAIVIMYCVTQTQWVFQKLPVPIWLRPVVGGIPVACLAASFPSVLSAGHGGVGLVLAGKIVPSLALLLLLLKAVASCLSIGSGFRGGLFFASLFLGVLAGEGFGDLLAHYGLAPADGQVCAVLGMAAMATAIIGGPMTMICLVLEMTGNMTISSAVVLAAVLSLLTVRRLFGYNFATWRFHLRGETIRSAVDVGRLRALTVQKLMRAQVRSFPAAMTIQQAQAQLTLGIEERLVLVDEEGRYQGIVLVSEITAAPTTEKPVSTLACYRDVMLDPNMTIREAADLFAEAEADVLAVVEDRQSRQLVGQLSERHTLRCYAVELERSRRDLAGDGRFSV